MNWDFNLPVKILFGLGRVQQMVEMTRNMGKGLLICDRFLVSSTAMQIKEEAQGRIIGIFCDLSPNPTVQEVDGCCDVIRKEKVDYLIAMGGGSVMDLAKAASVMAFGEFRARDYHSGGKPLPSKSIPVFAVPTTAGTGSEVTCVSVLTDHEKGIKAPMLSPLFYVDTAIIDPILTVSVPPRITASTGLDVLSHALEGYWSKNHQPLCDAAAMYAARLVFQYLMLAYIEPQYISAREKMCEASVIAGIAFSLPKTAGSHACSFPLTNVYGMPHGEACAFTLDSFIRINADDRLLELAHYCGFKDTDKMADEVYNIKKRTKMKLTLSDAGIGLENIEELAGQSMHPNMLNNPVSMDTSSIAAMYRKLA